VPLTFVTVTYTLYAVNGTSQHCYKLLSEKRTVDAEVINKNPHNSEPTCSNSSTRWSQH